MEAVAATMDEDVTPRSEPQETISHSTCGEIVADVVTEDLRQCGLDQDEVDDAIIQAQTAT